MIRGVKNRLEASVINASASQISHPESPESPLIDDEDITELLEAGVPQRSIAKEVGCSNGLVASISNGMKASAHNEPVAQNEHPESPESPLIDDEDINEPSAIPSQEAFQAAQSTLRQSQASSPMHLASALL